MSLVREWEESGLIEIILFSSDYLCADTAYSLTFDSIKIKILMLICLLGVVMISYLTLMCCIWKAFFECSVVVLSFNLSIQKPAFTLF